MNEDAKLLTQALAALVLLVDGDHDKDCRYQNTPINECPTCSGRHTKIAREAIKALTKRVAVYTAAPAPQAQPDWLLKTAQDLANSIRRRCFPEVPQFQVLDDLAGVISQIDNMTTGMERKAAPQPAQGES